MSTDAKSALHSRPIQQPPEGVMLVAVNKVRLDPYSNPHLQMVVQSTKGEVWTLDLRVDRIQPGDQMQPLTGGQPS